MFIESKEYKEFIENLTKQLEIAQEKAIIQTIIFIYKNLFANYDDYLKWCENYNKDSYFCGKDNAIIKPKVIILSKDLYDFIIELRK